MTHNESINRLGAFGPGGIHCVCCSYGRAGNRKAVRIGRKVRKAEALALGYEEYLDEQEEDENEPV